MITIEIKEEVYTKMEMVYLLEKISKMIDEGYSNGYYPIWKIIGEEESEED